MEPMRKSTVIRLRHVAVAASLLVVLFPLADRASAACGAGALTPQLHEFMVNQGLPYDRVGTSLVRGKDTLARLFLSMPSCAAASDTIAVTGGSLTVSNGTTQIGTGTLFSPTVPTAVLSSYVGTAPTPDNAGDPLFTVPGRILTPCGGTTPCADDGFTATFTATISFTANNGAQQRVTFSQNASIAKKSNALRVLVIPMGDTSQPFRTQFSPAAEAATRQGLTTLARILPVPGSVGELCPPSTTGDCGPAEGGVRYHLDLAGMVNLKDPTLGLNAYRGTPPKFCGGANNFDAIKAQLAQFLLTWNVLHPNNQADISLGVVDEAISASFNLGCVDGMGAIQDHEAWVRAIPDSPDVVSRTGATMGMETGHTFGVVKSSVTYHSSNVRATTPEIASRAYNVDQRRFIASDHSVMNFTNTGGPWNNDTAFLEWLDQADSLCLLNGPTTTECTTPRIPAGSSDNVSAGPTVVLSGITDGTYGGTRVTESYETSDIPRTTSNPSSPYRLVESGTAGRTTDGFDVHFPFDSHNQDNQTATAQRGVFEFALADGVGHDSFALYFCPATAPALCASDPEHNAGVFLYGAKQQTVTPAVTGSRSLSSGAATNFTRSGPALQNSRPSLTADGKWLAFQQAHIGNSVINAVQMLDKNGHLKTVESRTGATIDDCRVPTPSYPPFAMTDSSDGVMWAPVNFTGSAALGDGFLYSMTTNCKIAKKITLGSGPGGPIPSDVGAIATDYGGTASRGIWVASYDQHSYGGYLAPYGQFIFHLDFNGVFIDSCYLPSDAKPFEGVDTLVRADIAGLPGSGRYLITDGGGITTTSSKIYVMDTASCVGNALLTPVTSYPKLTGMGAGWWSPAGELWTTDGNSLINLGPPPFSTPVFQTDLSTTGWAPATGLSASSFRAEINVAPIGDITGAGVTGVPGGNGQPAFCPDGTLIFSTSTGDLYSTTPDLSTTPPSIPKPVRIYDADANFNRPAATHLTCGSDRRIIFEPSYGENDNSLYVLTVSPYSLNKVPLPAGECGVNPSASPTPGDHRIVYRFFSCVGGGGGLAIIDIDTGARTFLKADDPPAEYSAQPDSPDWGTDGRIAYRGGGTSNYQIRAMNLDATNDQLLSSQACPCSGPIIALKGRTLAYVQRDINAVLNIMIANTGQQGSGFDVRGAKAEDLRGDVIYQCANGVSEPVAVGLSPSGKIDAQTARFETTFDASNACGGGAGTLRMFANDGYTRAATPASNVLSASSSVKSPAAVISSPPDGATYSTDATIPLLGGGADAQDGQTPTVSWKVASLAAGSGTPVDANHPAGGWTPGTQTVQITTTNSAGILATATRTITIVDDRPPAVTLDHKSANAAGWNKISPVSVAVNATDDGTGLASLACTQDGVPVTPTPALTVGAHVYVGTLQATAEGATSFSCVAKDGAGLVSPAAADTVKIDTVPPLVSISSPSSAYAYMLNEKIAASYSCTDGTSGVDQCLAPVASGALVNTATVGTQTFAVNAIDVAGNPSSASQSYRVVDDHTPPALSVTHSANAAGWSRADPVVVTVSATDSELGVSKVSCTVDGTAAPLSTAVIPNAASYSGTLTVSGQGTHSIGCTASDRAPNISNTSDTVRIDTVAPSISVSTPSSNAVYLTGQQVIADYSCFDPTSGIASCTAPVASGQPLDTSTPGNKVFLVNSQDVAGNVATAAVPYAVNPRCSALPSFDSVYTTRPLFAAGGIKVTSQAPTVEATLSLLSPSCSGVNYRLHVMNSAGDRDLRFQDKAGDDVSSKVAFRVDMGNGTLGQFLDPPSVCVYAESQASRDAPAYDRIPATGCVSLNLDAPGKHTTN
ncbi:MAG: hypothetical protein NVSMB57_04900 [Actinomycetota bacterium]